MVGMALAERYPDYFPADYEPGNVTSQWYWALLRVHPHYRRQGVASTLLRAVKAWIRQHRGTALRSPVYANNSGSIALHRKMGFQEQGRFSCTHGAGEMIDFVLCLTGLRLAL